MKRRDVYLKLTRHNGRTGTHGTYNPKHNDRSFNLANSEHIDPERAKGNIYWDCFHGFRSVLAPQDPDDLAATFSEVEQQFYENRYSEFIVKPVGWPRSGKTLNDTDMKYILRRMEKYGISSEKKIESAIRIVANENRYHPIRDYLNGLQWDGTERIAHVLHHFLGAAEDEYTCEAMKIFLLGAIKRVFQPGCKFETMLCLVGGQGAGKSSFFRLLAVKDEWFSDDLRRLDDDNVYRKLQGHWIIEMSEMIATANAKSIEEIKSFLSKQKETYKVPYETHPADRLRQCVFAGTTNRQDFLPRDRTGNRRFIPAPVDAELAEVHILDNEEESRTYIDQLWAEAMTIYNSGNYKLAFSPAMQETLQAHQQDFMQEDAQAGMIYAFLEDYAGERVCSKQLYAEALGNTNIPAEWETRAICEIMNTGISRGDIPRLAGSQDRQALPEVRCSERLGARNQPRNRG